MNRTRIIVKRTNINRIFPGKPWVASCLKCRQDLLELLASRDLGKITHFTLFGLLDVFFVALAKFGTIKFRKVSHFGWIEQVPILVFLNAFHEFITDKYRRVRKTSTKIRIARVLAQIQKLWEVQMPVLHVKSGCSGFFAFARDSKERCVDHLHKWNRTS